MPLYSTTDMNSIFEGGRLKPGIYQIQDIVTERYLDIKIDTRSICCRPAKDLGGGRGFWEIKSLGAGYTVQFFEPGKPHQFCAPTIRSGTKSHLVVSPYPVPWRVQVVDSVYHHGFEYLQFFWGTTDFAWGAWDLYSTGLSLMFVLGRGGGSTTQRIWRLIPAKVEGAISSSQLASEILRSEPPSYSGDATGQFPVHNQTAEFENDDFNTIVTEVTTVTTTTRKKYRVEDS